MFIFKAFAGFSCVAIAGSSLKLKMECLEGSGSSRRCEIVWWAGFVWSYEGTDIGLELSWASMRWWAPWPCPWLSTCIDLKCSCEGWWLRFAFNTPDDLNSVSGINFGVSQVLPSVCGFCFIAFCEEGLCVLRLMIYSSWWVPFLSPMKFSVYLFRLLNAAVYPNYYVDWLLSLKKCLPSSPIVEKLWIALSSSLFNVLLAIEFLFSLIAKPIEVFCACTPAASLLFLRLLFCPVDFFAESNLLALPLSITVWLWRAGFFESRAIGGYWELFCFLRIF